MSKFNFTYCCLKRNTIGAVILKCENYVSSKFSKSDENLAHQQMTIREQKTENEIENSS